MNGLFLSENTFKNRFAPTLRSYIMTNEQGSIEVRSEHEEQEEQTKELKRKNEKKSGASRTFSGRRIALSAMFTAAAFGVSWLEFPLFPTLDFLKLDFSFALLLIGAYMLGPTLGGISVIAVQLLRLTITRSFGVGEIANLIAAACFIIVPSLIYRFKKGLPTVFISLAVGTVMLILGSLLFNRFITFPLFIGEAGKQVFYANIWLIVLFNLIKALSNGAITLLLYKRLKKLFNKML